MKKNQDHKKHQDPDIQPHQLPVLPGSPKPRSSLSLQPQIKLNSNPHELGGQGRLL
ncbi:hypothetical protein BGX38DRAFT_1197311 [Terfezia claveryi]|nr:hypothetical protein BGX38DRAFT_1197311 [Terfezia claveryi]